jgi:hypothetical protein
VKRRSFRAIVTDNSGQTIIGEKDTFAWNSAIRASEAIVRELARSEYCLYSGAKPTTLNGTHGGDDIYRRYWESPTGRRVTALVWEVL